ncbi:rab-like protein 6 [Aplochiton taeniatus]
MFSALKKLVGSEPGQVKEKNIPSGLQSMNQSLQRRFAKGVQYNMKIVIRGDRNTGKSTLWHRLQGKKFVDDYIPTQEIQATSIHWNYKTTDDVVKVEVWDVVDKGQKYPLPEGVGKGKKRGENLKTENDPQESDEVALDAEFLDVYKNCNGVIMIFDITKQWTFNYILRELPKVPTHVPVCVLGNHRDMGEHRVILPDEIREFITGLNRPIGSSYIHYAESSMKNGFGLKYLHRFFNIPFLQLQRETLLRQLETNQLDMDATLEELCVQQETEDQNYDIFLENIETQNKGYSPGPANGQSPSSESQSPIIPPNPASTGSSSPGTPQLPIPFQILPQSSSPTPSPPPPPPALAVGAVSPLEDSQPEAQSPEHGGPSSSPSPAGGPAAAASPVTAAAPTPQKRSFISRLFGSSSVPDVPAAVPETPAPVCPANVQIVDDFVPDEGLDKSFLEDSLPSKEKEIKPTPSFRDSDSDEDDRGNPMVTGFQDELDPDDTEAPLPQPNALPPSKDMTLSSGEGEGEPPPSLIQDPDLNSEPKLKGSIQSCGACGGGSPERRHQGPKKDIATLAEESDTDQEAPVGHQMLSYIMDDPDFDSEGSDNPVVVKECFPVRDELLSDVSDEDIPAAKVLAPLKTTVLSFKQKDDTDLFGLGIQEDASMAKDSSEDQEEKESRPTSKEKKKKKRKSKEEEEKSKKKHKHKKKEKEETGVGDEKEKKKKKSRTKKTEVDDLEDFLGGGEGSTKREGGDYEEL